MMNIEQGMSKSDAEETGSRQRLGVRFSAPLWNALESSRDSALDCSAPSGLMAWPSAGPI